jgi:hypothetical protein
VTRDWGKLTTLKGVSSLRIAFSFDENPQPLSGTRAESNVPVQFSGKKKTHHTNHVIPRRRVVHSPDEKSSVIVHASTPLEEATESTG